MFYLSNLEKKDIFIDIPESDFNSIIFHVIRHSRISHKEAIFNGIIAREQLKTTAIGNNIAIPHCRLKNFDGFYIKLALFNSRLGYCAPNGEEIRYMFLTAVSDNYLDYYLRTLAHIVKTMKNDILRKKLLGVKNTKEVCQLFQTYAVPELKQAYAWK